MADFIGRAIGIIVGFVLSATISTYVGAWVLWELGLWP
jgi:hypothetical protein